MAARAFQLCGMAGVAAAVALAGTVGAAALEAFVPNGDAIELPLGGKTGNAARGKEIVLDRALGNCLICHEVPVPAEPFQGDVGPGLAGVGSRLSLGQLRLRVADQRLVNPQTMMPPYFRDHGLRRVAPVFAGKPILNAQQVEDVAAWLSSLKDTPE